MPVIFSPSPVGKKNKYLSHTHQHTISTEILFSKACYDNRRKYFGNEIWYNRQSPVLLWSQLSNRTACCLCAKRKLNFTAKKQKFRQCSMQKWSPSVLSDAEVPRPVSPLSAVPGRRPKRLWNFSDTAGVCHSMSANRANVYVNENHIPT